MLRDLKYALGILAKSPAFTPIALATLALGIGANMTIFSVANALLLRALPCAHPGQLVPVSEGEFNSQGSYPYLSYPFSRMVREHGRSYSGVAACTYETFNPTGHADAHQIASAPAGADLKTWRY
jgi:putative ABC transport system permease protein